MKVLGSFRICRLPNCFRSCVIYPVGEYARIHKYN